MKTRALTVLLGTLLVLCLLGVPTAAFAAAAKHQVSFRHYRSQEYPRYRRYARTGNRRLTVSRRRTDKPYRRTRRYVRYSVPTRRIVIRHGSPGYWGVSGYGYVYYRYPGYRFIPGRYLYYPRVYRRGVYRRPWKGRYYYFPRPFGFHGAYVHYSHGGGLSLRIGW